MFEIANTELKSNIPDTFHLPFPTWSHVSRKLRMWRQKHHQTTHEISDLIQYIKVHCPKVFFRRKSNSNSIFFYNIGSLYRLANTILLFGDGSFTKPRFRYHKTIHRQVYRLDAGFYNTDFSRGITLPCILAY